MVRQLLLPKEGGGALRRFLGMRTRLFRDQWNDSRPMRGPVPLFDFRRHDDAADVKEALNPNRMRGLFPGWRVSDDSVIGGYSRSGMEFHDGVGGGDAAIEEGSNNNGATTSPSPPFLRWSGNVSTEINRQSHLARNITRSGFAAILSPEFPFGAPLKNKYYALEICCRTDGRTYAVNLHVESYFPEDMYQGFIVGGAGDGGLQKVTSSRLDKSRDVMNATSSPIIQPASEEVIKEEGQQTQQQPPDQILDVREHLRKRQTLLAKSNIYSDDHPYHGHPPAGFQRYILPFREFALTSRGRMRHTQRDLDGAINIESIGFTLMDGKDGDFCFDLVSLRAVNVLEGEVVVSLEDEMREEEFQDGLLKQRSSSSSSDVGGEKEKENEEDMLDKKDGKSDGKS